MSTPWEGRKLHFVGIGGAGMSGLALVADALGASVTGSDRAESSYLERLRGVGIRPAIGHRAENLPEGDDVELVFSTAVPENNPERLVARQHGLKELHRADLLAEITRLKPCIAVAGTHGKTTTSSMVVHMLSVCGLKPSYLVGGEVRSTGSNAGWDDGEWLVVEADESDRSLLKLESRIAVLTNLELDHHATYSSQLDLDETLRCFLESVPQTVVWNRRELLALCKEGSVTPFEPEGLELFAGGSRFSSGGTVVELSVPGEHNARNAAAALEAVRLTGADPEYAAATLKGFQGAGRRFELLGTHSSGAELYDDYAHHPTEVEATLAAARTLEPKRLVAVFQPHLYSRTAELAQEFGAALAAADLVLVLDIYPAREDPADFPGVSGLLIAEAAADTAAGSRICWFRQFSEAGSFLSKELRAGDLCLFLGAGDVDRLGRKLISGSDAGVAL